MNTQEMASRYVSYHKNPIGKVDLPHNKYFLTTPDNFEEELKTYLDKMYKTLKYERVDRRCARSNGTWLEDRKLCKINKVVGNISERYGFQDKTGIYLTPEEALFLLEQNKLELSVDGNQISISEFYETVMKNLLPEKYKVYKHLVLQGFKLSNRKSIRSFYIRHSKLKEKKNVSHTLKRKKSPDVEEDNANKISKLDYCDSDKVNYDKKSKKENTIMFDEIFKSLRENGPTMLCPEISSNFPDYFGFCPTTSKVEKHNFNLHLRNSFSLKEAGNYEDVQLINAISTRDNTAFFRFPFVNLPILE